jgi:hypothetical protein
MQGAVTRKMNTRVQDDGDDNDDADDILSSHELQLYQVLQDRLNHAASPCLLRALLDFLQHGLDFTDFCVFKDEVLATRGDAIHDECGRCWNCNPFLAIWARLWAPGAHPRETAPRTERLYVQGDGQQRIEDSFNRWMARMEKLYRDKFPCMPLGLLIFPNAGEFVRVHAHDVIEVLRDYRTQRTQGGAADALANAVMACNCTLGACIPGWRAKLPEGGDSELGLSLLAALESGNFVFGSFNADYECGCTCLCPSACGCRRQGSRCKATCGCNGKCDNV